MAVVHFFILLAAIAVSPGYGGDTDYCLRFGGGSCCPQLNAIDRTIEDTVMNQPNYIVFFPRSEDSVNIDNVCYTFFPLPDDNNTVHLYVSSVYNDGSNDIISYILSQPELGVRRFGKGICQLTDTVFGQVECDSTVYVTHRCRTYGDCLGEGVVGGSGVFGFSNTRQPISKSCINKAAAANRNNGLPEDDFFILPMRLPSKCVLNQVCSIASNVQRFCQTVGVYFPTIGTCANQYY